MPQIYSAFASEVKVNEETIEGLQSIDYSLVKNTREIGAIGTDERIGVYFGLKQVAGALRVASDNVTLDGLLADNSAFSISAILRHGETTRMVAFDECFLHEKSFALAANGHGETIYAFTATRVREE